jgi:hypothetical protein
MRYQVGAEQLQQVPTLLHRPDTALRAGRVAPAGPTHAVSARTGQAACGITADGLEVLDQDWEEALFVEKCPRCFAAVLADTSDQGRRSSRPSSTALSVASVRERQSSLVRMLWTCMSTVRGLRNTAW